MRPVVPFVPFKIDLKESGEMTLFFVVVVAE